MGMIRNRLFLAAAALCVMGRAALAQDSCKPVETAPGIKAIPAGCNKLSQLKTGAAVAAPKAAPAAKPSGLFPGSSPGSVTKFGDTEVRIGGSVRYEYGYGR